MKFILLDTETANDLDCPLVYDFGFAVIDERANVYESFSFVIADIFLNKELMASAYFAEKVPMYWEQLKKGNRSLVKFNTARKILRQVMRKYHINTVIAHNIRFDYIACQTTQRYLTKSKYRWFFPYNTDFIDTLKLSRLVLKNNNKYIQFCKDNNFTLKNGTPRYTAEILYRYLTQNIGFIESHTGLEDVMIEKEIFKMCLEQGATINQGLLW